VPRHDAPQASTLSPGDRRLVTTLIADIRGSMELAGGVDQEVWHQIIERFFALMRQGIGRLGGTVISFTGDGVVAIFGAPSAQEDHAQRACQAAIELRTELRRYAATVRRAHGLTLTVRMGINSGEVVAGAIGDEGTPYYTAVGPAVGLAQRMEQLAAPGTVYVTDRTARQASASFRFRDVGTFAIKGVSQPARVFELQGSKALLTRLEVSPATGRSRLVGRSGEVEMLEDSLARVVGGQGRIVGIVGDPGVGKSRLCEEFVQRCRERDISILNARGISHGKDVPFLPILQLYRDLFGVVESDSDHLARSKITSTLLSLDGDFKDDLWLLLEFLGVPDRKHGPLKASPEVRQRRLLAIIKRIVVACSRREPVVILLEDLHWFDGASETLIAGMAEAIPQTRTLMLVTCRPEYVVSWVDGAQYVELPLAPLDAQAAGELVEELMGSDPSLETLATRILERAVGNPFFIEEIVFSLAEEGVVDGGRGDYRVLQPVASVIIPATVQSVLGARIERLPEATRTVLQVASVVGKEFSEKLLREVLGEDPSAALQNLMEAQFIVEIAAEQGTAYSFRHPLTQEVAYWSQLTPRRTTTHRSVAQAIAAVNREKLDERAAILAYHWECGGSKLKAARWSRRAAEWAGVHNPVEALRHWLKVVAILDPISRSKGAFRLALDAQIRVLQFGWRAGLSEQDAASIFQTATALAADRGGIRDRAQIMGAHATLRMMEGSLGDALEHAMEAVRLADEIGDVALQAALRNPACVINFYLGDLTEALGIADRTLELVDGDYHLGVALLGFSPGIFAVYWRGWTRMYMGYFGEASAELERAAELAHEHGDVETLCWALAALSNHAQLAGDTSRAHSHAQAAVEIAERLGSSVLSTFAYSALGGSLLMRGAWDAAGAVLDRALTTARQSFTALHREAWMLTLLAETYLGGGHVELAQSTAGEALRIARQRGTVFFEARAGLTVARVMLAVDPVSRREAIQDVLKTALAAAVTSRARSLEPLIHIEYARLAACCADEPARAAEVREACRLLEEMGLPTQATRVAWELGGAGGAAGATPA
jgi:adenylate cyclase